MTQNAKNRLIECNKRYGPWYVLNGVEGIIIDTNNERFKDTFLTHISLDQGLAFVAFADINFELNDNDALYDYSNHGVSGDEIVYEHAITLFNSHELQYTFIAKKDFENDLYVRQLLITTDETHDWKSDRTQFIENCVAGNCSAARARELWSCVVSRYEGRNHYSPDADSDYEFTRLWGEIALRKEAKAEEAQDGDE